MVTDDFFLFILIAYGGSKHLRLIICFGLIILVILCANEPIWLAIRSVYSAQIVQRAYVFFWQRFMLNTIHCRILWMLPVCVCASFTIEIQQALSYFVAMPSCATRTSAKSVLFFLNAVLLSMDVIWNVYGLMTPLFICFFQLSTHNWYRYDTKYINIFSIAFKWCGITMMDSHKVCCRRWKFDDFFSFIII